MSEEIKKTEGSGKSPHHSSSHHHGSSHHHSSSGHHSSSHSHHSSSHSSKKSKSSHSSSSDTRSEKLGRNILAFALFLTVSLLSLSVCVRVAFVSPQSIVKIFVNEEYVTALHDDIINYSHAKCLSCMLPEDTLDDAITYRDIYSLENAYISGAMGASKDYTKTTYEDNAEDIKTKVKDAVNARIKADGLTVDKKQKNGADGLTESISEYILKRLEIAHIDKLEAAVNIGKIVSLIGIIASAVFAVIFALIVVSIGSKRYRAMRWIVHSINAAALLNLILVFGIEIVKKVKSLVFYPAYLADAFLRYVGRCEMAVSVSSAVLFLIALVLTCIVWRMNRNSKE